MQDGLGGSFNREDDEDEGPADIEVDDEDGAEGCGEEGEAAGAGDDEDEEPPLADDMQLAWECLDNAKRLFERHSEGRLMHERLAEVRVGDGGVSVCEDLCVCVCECVAHEIYHTLPYPPPCPMPLGALAAGRPQEARL